MCALLAVAAVDITLILGRGKNNFCRSAFKSKNGQFIDIKSDNDGNKPWNLIDAHSG